MLPQESYTLDAFDEWDLCDSFMGLPIWWFNPTFDFGDIYARD